MPQRDNFWIVDRLASILYEHYKAGRQGLLHKALNLVALEVGKGDRSFLADQDASVTADLNQDDRALFRLGFSRVFKREVRKDNEYFVIDKESCGHLIMAAATIILLSDYEDARGLAAGAKGTASRGPLQAFTLALVVRGVDLSGIESNGNPALEEVVKWVGKAGYFACFPEDKMLGSLSALNLDEEGVDRESEQQVLVPITFRRYERLPVDSFENKLQLIQYLRQDAQGFTVGTLSKLLTISGLGKSGFIRV